MAAATLVVLSAGSAGAAPSLVVPAAPTEQGVVQGSGPLCSTDITAPAVVADPTPRMTARLDTVPGSEQAGYLRAEFTVQSRQTNGSWTEVASLAVPSAGYVTAGQAVVGSAEATLVEGTLYREAASTLSYTADGTRHIRSHSTAHTTGWCYFTVDPTAPRPPKVTLGAPYIDCAVECSPEGGPGIAGSFSFEPADGDSPVAAYQYRLGSTWSETVHGSTVRLDIAPPDSGLTVLQVRAQDGIGRWGLATRVTFNVALPSTAVGTWHFSDGKPGDGSTTAADTATGPGERHTAELASADADWSPLGRLGDGDGALALGGTTGHASTEGPAVDTSRSFAVSAWVFATGLGRDRTVLSQTGADGSGFGLGYSETAGTWQFQRTWNDGGTRETAAAVAGTPATAGVWTYLAGSYDSAAHTLTLYVNGRPQGAPVAVPAVDTEPGADGDLEFGRVVAAAPGGYEAHWSGRLDEVGVWQRALSARDVRVDAQLLDVNSTSRATAQVAAWDPAGASGTALADTASGYGRTLTLDGGARLDGGAIELDGVDGAASTAGPVVDPSGSFTVTTRVRLDTGALAALPAGSMVQVVGQRSPDGSAWGIWSRVGRMEVLDPETSDLVTVPTAQWMFGRATADGTFTGVSEQEAQILDGTTPDRSIQVTGVYDAPNGTAALYVGDRRQGEIPFVNEAGVGDLTIGKAHGSGAWAHYLPGRVEDIRLWAGAMDTNTLVSVIGL
ncbi:laminin G domain-containing protein [Streptomyces sp. GMY02]|uniref:LamG domain-containing protein n=1 Tax=Streptomyces sp. GMY02 TaxID=1333528 RepID=UPI001C2BBC09|nr:LamG domain-containing protein [Streptomyces sp. GMY02]QXE35631.1 laminin G domain-containing protein [Streptomyces sp. GMY02]